MASAFLSPDRLQAAGIGAFFRPRDLEAVDLSFADLQSLVAQGAVEKIARGIYRLRAIEPNAFETLAMMASAAPNAIVCLLSALSVHGIGAQVPHEVWLAIDHKGRRPAKLPALVRIVRFSGGMLTYGVDTMSMLGVPVRITSPARTVADCFRFRRKIGLDVALEALRETLRSRAATMDQITRAAEVCRVGTVIRPYLEAMASR